jgi:trans-aconitate methyltransferase
METHMRSAQRVRNGIRGLLQAYGSGTIKRHLWNGEFARGRWNCPDRPATDFAYPCVEKYACDGSILDLGCGAGRAANELDATAFQRYTGVDVSDVALESARTTAAAAGRSAQVFFTQSDIASYVPAERHDVILFMESLYYVPWARIPALLDRYSNYLKPAGVFIVRMWTGTDKYLPIVKIIENQCAVVEKQVSEDPNAILIVFQPRVRRHHEA